VQVTLGSFEKWRT